MKFITYVIAIALLSGAAFSGQAWADRDDHDRDGGHFRFGVVMGPDWPYFPPTYYHPYYSPGYPPAVIVQSPPVVESPPVYIEQGNAAPPAVSQPDNYWYYCSSPQGYYPYIKECPAGWERVQPQTPPHQ